jgi:hypothetical protein
MYVSNGIRTRTSNDSLSSVNMYAIFHKPMLNWTSYLAVVVEVLMRKTMWQCTLMRL